MPVLRCTTKLLAEIDDSVNPTPSDPSPIGDWYGHLFSIDRRKCIVLINEPTLCVCFAPGITKAQYRQIVPFFIKVLESTLETMSFTAEETKCILGCQNNLTIGKTINRSTMGSLNNRVTDAKCLIEYHGGFDFINPQSVEVSLNNTPMKPIGYRNGLEKMKRLVAELMKTPCPS